MARFMAGPLRSAAAAIALSAGLGLSACHRGGAGEGATEAPREAPFVVQVVTVRDMKPAFAQVDSADAVSARARIGGTVSDLRVREGANVARGQVLAIIADARLPLQAQAEGAQAQALRAQLAQARTDLRRYEQLHADGFYPTQRLEQVRAQVRSLEDQVRAAQSQRAVTVESSAQGAVTAPVAGRVLRVPVRRGGVVMMGEEIALVGSAFILKVRMPERHASYLREGGVVEVERADGSRGEGRVRKVYPALSDGRVEADVEFPGLQSRVFGERVRVWTPADERQAIVAPAAYLTNRYGVDFARVRRADGVEQDVVVRLGEPVSAEGVESGVEILSGLNAGDQLVRPVAAAPAGAHAP